MAFWIVRYPRLISAVSLLVALICCIYSYRELRYSNDRTQMLAADDPCQRAFEDYRREFPDINLDVLTVVGGGEEFSRLQALAELQSEVGKHPDFFLDSLYRVDVADFEKASLYALTLKELKFIEDDLRVGLPMMQAPDMLGLLEYLGQLQGDQLAAATPTLRKILGQLTECFENRGHGPPRQPWKTPNPAFREGFLNLTIGNANFLVVRLSPQEGALERLTAAIAEVRGRYPNLRFDLVGDYAVKTEDGRVSLRSALGCSLISLVLVKLLFLYTSAHRRRPQLALLALFGGLSWSMAWATWTVRELNLVSVNFAATLVGLGMDFAIHLLFRYEEHLETATQGSPGGGGGTLDSAQLLWRQTLATSGKENLVGALATATAFLSLCGTPFRGVQQLGWVSGSGIVWIFLAMMLLFPALLQTWGRMTPGTPGSYRRLDWLGRLEGRWLESAPQVLVLTILLTAASAAGIPRLHFDSNLLHMTWVDSLALRSEEAFRRYQGTSCQFLVSMCSDAVLSRRVSALEGLDGHVESLAGLVKLASPDTDQRLCVDRILDQARRFPPPRPVHRYPSDQLLALRDRLPKAMDRLRSHIHDEQLVGLLDRLKKATEGLGPGSVQEALFAFEQGLAEDGKSRLAFLRSQKSDVPSLDRLPPLLLQRYRGSSGRWLIKVYPRADIWEEEPLSTFLGQIQTIDPDATGTPILTRRYLELLNSGYRQAGWTALSVIVVLLLLYFRNPWHAFLALLPKLLGLVWMLGLLGWAGAAFNPANSTALPLTLGVGLVFGVHVLHRLLSGKEERVFRGSTGAAVAVSAASTILGYAALTLAPHRGIASLGWVMMLGVGANFIAAVVVLPSLLSVLRGEKRS